MLSFLVAALMMSSPVQAAPKSSYELCVEQCLSWMDTSGQPLQQCIAQCAPLSTRSLMTKTSFRCETYEQCEDDQQGSTDMDGNENEPQDPGPDEAGADI